MVEKEGKSRNNLQFDIFTLVKADENVYLPILKFATNLLLAETRENCFVRKINTN